ncbi:rCG48956 [Rattus norvegicus]|uniref:RCG48956 n=1 Tax=Rattus norvegicus TaxID=10116 RepID=A6IG22_RAT|nr:rCG48956 [Rattus norvegicus]
MVLLAATSITARLSSCLLGGFSGFGTQSACKYGVASACQQGSQRTLPTVGYFTAPPLSKNIFLRINMKSTVTVKHHIDREFKGILDTE